MEAVSQVLRSLIIELQNLSSLNLFALAGGTNLAIRYNHRKSEDIDFIVPTIVGIDGLEYIRQEINDHFGTAVLYCEIINKELGDQFCFLRAFITRKEEGIKIELLQNMRTLDKTEIVDNFRLVSKKDIGLFKLMSASNRKANKDIYDLDYITDEISLYDLLNFLKNKQELFDQPEHRNLFDLDHEMNPLTNLNALLEFDNIDYSSLPSRPSHSNDRISIVPPNKEWRVAKNSWRRKVRDLMRSKGMEPPAIKPVN